MPVHRRYLQKNGATSSHVCSEDPPRPQPPFGVSPEQPVRNVLGLLPNKVRG